MISKFRCLINNNSIFLVADLSESVTRQSSLFNSQVSKYAYFLLIVGMNHDSVIVLVAGDFFSVEFNK